MASRNIANMHLFLEMKKKFPDLPEDTIRNCVFLYAEDKNKCVSMLQNESKLPFHSSKKFQQFRLAENKTRYKAYQKKKSDIDHFQSFSKHNSLIPQNNFVHKISGDTNKRQSDRQEQNDTGLNANYTTNLPLKQSNQDVSKEKNFNQALENNNTASNNFYQASTSQLRTASQMHTEADRPMMFSTTKEHTIIPVERECSDNNPRHAVKLSITPSFPFSQQQMSVYTSTVSTPVSQSTKTGRHTTSLNLQLQPAGEDTYPVEISTVPTNVTNLCDSRDFASHLQISVDAQGATFTALRLQRPQVSASQSVAPSFNMTSCSSQAQDSKSYILQQAHNTFTKKPGDNLSRITSSNECQSRNYQIAKMRKEIDILNENVASQYSYDNTSQESQEYIQAVIKHQLARLELAREELQKERATCSKLKTEVNELEQERVRQQDDKRSFYADLLTKIKEENRKLRLECNCLLMEYDICSKGQIPVGMTDEDFYSNIFTGPNDGLALHSNGNNLPDEKTLSRTRKFSEDEDDNYKWKCKKCTFANHPALKKCEMCELPRNSGSFFDES